jgi:23S rRNA (adenine2503-C2)-methyltransferase
MATKIANLSKFASVEKTISSRDGTTKFLLRLNDGNLIECVLLVQDYGATACISSQVGCKMKCAFCASGTHFVRNLSMEEMLVQVLVVKKELERKNKEKTNAPNAGGVRGGFQTLPESLNHIVIMGSGEPFENFDNVAAFLDAVDIGARKISVSTCGLPDGIRAFADLGIQANLCVSLHAPNDGIRASIMPIARVHKIAKVMEAVKYFFDKTHRRVIFEYALIDGVNCQAEHARELAYLIKGAKISAHVNLINLNATKGAKLQPPTREKAMKFMDTLIKQGVSVTMRKSLGSEIAAACGQLVSRVQEENNATCEKIAGEREGKSFPLASNFSELSISLDPAFAAGDWREYLAEINGLDGISIHLDVMRESMVGHDRVSEEQIQYVIENSRHPIDVHVMAIEEVKIPKNPRVRCVCTHRGDEMLAQNDDGTVFVVMSVKPGKSGQTFMPDSIERIKETRREHPTARIILDGGVTPEIIAGGVMPPTPPAVSVVMGNFIYKQTSQTKREQTVKELLGILRK